MPKVIRFAFYMMAIGLLIQPGCSKRSHSEISIPISEKDIDLKSDTSLLEGAVELEMFFKNSNFPGNKLDSQNEKYADVFSRRGVDLDLLLEISGDKKTAAKLAHRVLTGKGSFLDYFRLSEVAVIAKVRSPHPGSPMTFAGPAYYNVEIIYDLKNTTDNTEFIALNGVGAHDKLLTSKLECVFFLSPTLTKLEASERNSQLPQGVLLYSFSPYCTNDGNTYEISSQLGGDEKISKSEVFNFSQNLSQSMSVTKK